MTVGSNSGVCWCGESLIGPVLNPLVLRNPGDELPLSLTNISSIAAISHIDIPPKISQYRRSRP